MIWMTEERESQLKKFKDEFTGTMRQRMIKLEKEVLANKNIDGSSKFFVIVGLAYINSMINKLEELLNLYNYKEAAETIDSILNEYTGMVNEIDREIGNDDNDDDDDDGIIQTEHSDTDWEGSHISDMILVPESTNFIVSDNQYDCFVKSNIKTVQDIVNLDDEQIKLILGENVWIRSIIKQLDCRGIYHEFNVENFTDNDD